LQICRENFSLQRAHYAIYGGVSGSVFPAATAGEDFGEPIINGAYVKYSGTINIPTGVSSLQIVVPIIADNIAESNEVFAVQLTNPVNAIFKDSSATSITAVGTIMDDDFQSVIYVNQNASGNSDGTSWADAYTTLSAALADAEAGQEIWIAGGTYSGEYTTNGISIFGVHNIDGSGNRGPDTIITGTINASGSLVLGGLNFTSPTAQINVGTDGSHIAVEQSTFDGCSGQVLNVNGSNNIIDISNVLVINASGITAGGYLQAAGVNNTINVLNSTFANNTGDAGSVICVAGTGSSANIMNTIMWGNATADFQNIIADKGASGSIKYSDIESGSFIGIDRIGDGVLNVDPQCNGSAGIGQMAML
jgi:hypothetical protein